MINSGGVKILCTIKVWPQAILPGLLEINDAQPE